MYDYFDNTASDQHDHDHGHGTAGSDVGPDDGHNSNSESKHDEERNHHNQEKESNDMNRTIKNSSAPILTGFTLSVMFILSSAFNAAGFDKSGFNCDPFNRVFATAEFRIGDSDFDQIARSYEDDSINSFNANGSFNFNGRAFARAAEGVFIGFRNDKIFDFDDTNFARPDFDPIGVDNDRFASLDKKDFYRFDNVSFNPFDDAQFDGFNRGFIAVANYFQFAPVDSYNIAGFNRDSFGSKNFVG